MTIFQWSAFLHFVFHCQKFRTVASYLIHSVNYFKCMKRCCLWHVMSEKISFYWQWINEKLGSWKFERIERDKWRENGGKTVEREGDINVVITHGDWMLLMDDLRESASRFCFTKLDMQNKKTKEKWDKTAKGDRQRVNFSVHPPPLQQNTRLCNYCSNTSDVSRENQNINWKLNTSGVAFQK